VNEHTTLAAIRPEATTSTRKVLVADDEAGLAKAIGRVLKAAGFEVVVVNDGNQAVNAIVQSSFDVILSDINMPGTSGIDLLRVIRAYDLDVPVVLMTATPEVDDVITALDLGALRYLTKPFSLETVVSVIERASKLHRLARLKREALAFQGRHADEAGDVTALGLSLDRALDTMWMAYQPIVNVRSRHLIAYEGLMRSDEATLPHPGAVLEAAERLGRLNDLGRRVRALVAHRIPDAPSDALIFVNLHPQDLLDPDLASAAAPLSRFAERVVLEVTERSALENVKDVVTRVEILRYLGFRIAIDDLGAGYAGLTSFATLEPEFVKLDMSLVRDIHLSNTRQTLVRSLISLCGELKKGIIAEGVEVPEERDQLVAVGCESMQGFLFAKPGHPFPTAVWD
jgi:EAL domain-containing protein (putative c-di-GMP-specific phosphodiesterase class I)/CheY-like chemotaxis protein